MARVSLVPFVCVLIGVTSALELAGTQEGSCRNNGNIPFHRDVDPVWLDTLPYINAGSKYHLYRAASVHPRFRQMREFEFYYDACFVKNTSLAEGNGSIFGFRGQVLGSFDVRPAGGDDPTALVDAFPNNPRTGTRGDFFRQRVTLTDYRTFAVMVHCWMGIDQKSWNVYSVVPKLDEATERLIEDHIQSIGFDREKIIFLRYDNCENLEVPTTNRGDNEKRDRPVKIPLIGSSPNNKVRPAIPTTERSVEATKFFGKRVVGVGSQQSGSIKRGIPSGGANTLRNLSTTTTTTTAVPTRFPVTAKTPTSGNRDKRPTTEAPGNLGWTGS